MEHLGKLVEFYPRHIDKEDKHFFIPCMAYFSEAEQADLLARMHEFDRLLIHEKYRGRGGVHGAAAGLQDLPLRGRNAGIRPVSPSGRRAASPVCPIQGVGRGV